MCFVITAKKKAPQDCLSVLPSCCCWREKRNMPIGCGIAAVKWRRPYMVLLTLSLGSYWSFVFFFLPYQLLWSLWLPKTAQGDCNTTSTRISFLYQGCFRRFKGTGTCTNRTLSYQTQNSCHHLKVFSCQTWIFFFLFQRLFQHLMQAIPLYLQHNDFYFFSPFSSLVTSITQLLLIGKCKSPFFKSHHCWTGEIFFMFLEYFLRHPSSSWLNIFSRVFKKMLSFKF